VIKLTIKLDSGVNIIGKINNKDTSLDIQVQEYTFMINKPELVSVSQIHDKQLLGILGNHIVCSLKKFIRNDHNLMYIHNIIIPPLTLIFTDDNGDQYTYTHTDEIYFIDSDYVWYTKNRYNTESFEDDINLYLEYWTDRYKL
jgi:cytochrome oxidase Cu insertion factor (SCO1/SenC/PrrC family)